MSGIRVRVAHLPRSPRFVGSDDAIGGEMWRELCSHLDRGVPRPAVLSVFDEVVQVVDVAPVLVATPDQHRALAAFASQEGSLAIAIAGVLTRRQRGVVVGRDAMVFLEWPDGRWWWSRRPVGLPGAHRVDAEDVVERAVDGSPKPVGLGGWYGRARFEQIRLKLESQGNDVN